MNLPERKVVSQCISSDYCRGWNDCVCAISVVCCKDCKHYESYDPEEGIGACGLISYVMDGYYHGTTEMRKPDDFCSCGERRNDNAQAD